MLEWGEAGELSSGDAAAPGAAEVTFKASPWNLYGQVGEKNRKKNRQSLCKTCHSAKFGGHSMKFGCESKIVQTLVLQRPKMERIDMDRYGRYDVSGLTHDPQL